MGQGRNWLEKLSEGMDLPGEPIPGQPLVDLAGDRRVLVENHSAVIHYSGDMICVKVRYGHIRICGDCLSLSRMTKSQLVISGRIDSITLVRR